MADLRVIPASRADVAAFIARVHRHHKPSIGDVFRLAAVRGDGLVVGVASVGRPVARMSDDGWTLEVNRVATDGTRNACSILYGAARRAAWAMGYRRLLTYTLPDEGGASLRASGWTCDGERGTGVGWGSRPGREDAHPGTKMRWSCANETAFSGDPSWPDGEDSPQLALFAQKGIDPSSSG